MSSAAWAVLPAVGRFGSLRRFDDLDHSGGALSRADDGLCVPRGGERRSQPVAPVK